MKDKQNWGLVDLMHSEMLVSFSPHFSKGVSRRIGYALTLGYDEFGAPVGYTNGDARC